MISKKNEKESTKADKTKYRTEYSGNSPDSARIINALELLYHYSVLKYCSDKEHPLSPKEVNTLITGFNDHDMNDREQYRKLPYLANLHRRACGKPLLEVKDSSIPAIPQREECGYLDLLLTSLLGGYIDGTEKAYGRRYWFEPILDCSDAELIQASITANRFLSSEEKEYLLSALKIIFPPSVSRYTSPKYLLDFKHELLIKPEFLPDILAKKYRDILDSQEFPPKPREQTNGSATGSQHTNLLKNVNILRDAIEFGWQIELVYGEYGLKNGAVALIPKPKPYRLYPHSTLWNNGQFYLVCSLLNQKHDFFYHFRVDRIMEIKIITETRENSLNQPISFELDNLSHNFKRYLSTVPKPGMFDSYGNEISGKVCRFDDETYRNDHPLMSYEGPENQIITATVHCPSKRLSAVIDAFGFDSKKIKVKPITLTKEQRHMGLFDETDFEVTIHNIELNIIKRFCLQLQNGIVAISPPELLTAIHNDIKTYEGYYAL